MPNTAHTHIGRISVPRRLQQPDEATTLRSVWQDNPAAPRARAASSQPAPPKKEMRPPPFDEYKNDTHPGRPTQKKRRHTTTHLKPRVRAGIERIAEEQGLSVSATLAAIAEWFLTLSIYEQNAATLDRAVDTSIGRHMRTYSDRNASLQARNLQKTELLFHLVTNILGRMPGMEEETMRKILNDATDLANASIARTTVQQKNIVETEKQQFEKKGVGKA